MVVGGLRKRGRFCCGSSTDSCSSEGAGVGVLFRFRLLIAAGASCDSLALSKAFHARSSSCDSGSTAVVEFGGCKRAVAISRSLFAAPCRLASSSRLCQRVNSRRCSSVRCSVGSSSKGKSRSRSRRRDTSCQTRAQSLSFVGRARGWPAAGRRRGCRRTAEAIPGKPTSFSKSRMHVSQYHTSGTSS